MDNNVYLTLYEKKPLYMKIVTEDYEYIKLIKDEFTLFVDGFMHMPAYKCGNWSGKICLIDTNNIIPYGLLMDYIRIHKKNFYNNRLVISEDVKKLFKGPDIEPKWDLSLYPYDYQEDCIRTALKYSKGIIRAATASGKSLMISYIIKALFDNYDKTGVNKVILVVTGTNLMTQFYSDMIKYGFDKKHIGKVFASSKEWDRKIVISTWQSLANNHDKINNYDAIIVDECVDGDTMIKTPNGYKKIKNVNVGEKVISFNKEKEVFEEDIVLRKFENLSKEKTYKIYFDNGKEIIITGNHKILTTRGYIRADELDENDDIIDEKYK